MEPTIYLFFRGNCLEAMTHYAETFDGEIGAVVRNGDVPDPKNRMPGGDDLVMNMVLTLGHATVMASDSVEEMYERPQGFGVAISPRSREDFDRVFEALSGNAQAMTMPPAETFWAERFAMFTDRYGTPWMLNYEGDKAQA